MDESSRFGAHGISFVIFPRVRFATEENTAIADGDSDAIERAVTVRPNGREIVHTNSLYVTGSGKFAVMIPENALPNSQSAELRIYPNTMSHVAEALLGILRRPYGCGEQTISSTYPNLLILSFDRDHTGHVPGPVLARSRKFLQSGYERLVGYQTADGGFSYWGGKDEADFALTAYAFRFLADASSFITVDPDVVRRAGEWLV